MLIFRFSLVAAMTLFASAAAVPVQAQFPMAEGPAKERSQSDSERDLEERIANMRYLATLAEKSGAARKKDPKLAVEKLQEDFTRLQIVNKNLVLTTAKSSELDLEFVAMSASEINGRATRLMSNLALPELGNAPQRPSLRPISGEKELRAAITSSDP